MELKFKFLGRMCWTIEVDKKFKIGCDPSLSIKKELKTIAPVYDKEEFKNIKLWLITEGEKEHFDSEGASIIEEDAKIITRKESGKELRDKKNSNIYFVDWFKKVNLEIKGYKLIVEVIPAYRGGSFLSNPSIGKMNGYLLTIIHNSEVKKIYVTGDTVYHENVIKPLIYHIIDVMIANIGQLKNSGWSTGKTMDLVMLNSFIRTINPEKLITILSKNEASRSEMKKYIDLIDVGQEISL
ncbi:MBL fold metallo-hydrolase [Cetobacterium sp. 8H]|uniref:MBL fold metallo-hydrolase n=1 Tax=Cetobacterium sp. 8H TaxID=2759681 RepID=UPI00163D1B26|nr:MBL fold metallo-hydrolase [Cetobacterium sp. 8H]MBC2850402.1 MBL fold metallo-hydrolase [Cetobacterium sp. 8H]